MLLDTALLGSVNLASQAVFPPIPCGGVVPAGAVVTVCATVPDTGHDHPYAGGCTDSQGNTYVPACTIGDPTSLRFTGIWTSVLTTPLAGGDSIQPVMFWDGIGQGASVRCAGIAVRGG